MAGRSWSLAYVAVVGALCVVTLPLLLLRWPLYRRGAVAHIGENSHLHRRAVDALRKAGVETRYISVGPGAATAASDRHLRRIANPAAAAVRDVWVFWTDLSGVAAVHAHRGIGLSHYQWEFVLLWLLRRRIVVHFRGCEARRRHENMARHPEHNICEACDYAPNFLCESGESRRRRWIAKTLADRVVVTTPDMRDFWPDAAWIPFLPPDVPETPPVRDDAGRGRFRLVHVTNQPGIEGTDDIRAAVDALAAEGVDIDFVHLSGRRHAEVLAEIARADATIGKLKMGYYANAQVESLAMGVPVITWICDAFVNDAIRDGGFVLCPPGRVTETLRCVVTDPSVLDRARRGTRTALARLHDEADIVRRMRSLYAEPGQ